MGKEINRVFISYRRDDSRWFARALKIKLTAAIGEDRVFMDVDSIEPGVDFVDVIDDMISKVDVMIAILGPEFLTAVDDEGVRIIDNPANWVRLEIGTALQRNIRVIPLLHQGARLPNVDELPDDLKPLARRNAIQISELTFDADVDRIIDSLHRLWDGKESETDSTPNGSLAPALTPRSPATFTTPEPAVEEANTASPTSAAQRPAWLTPLLALGGIAAFFVVLWSAGVFSKTDAGTSAKNGSNSGESTTVPGNDTAVANIRGMVRIDPGKFTNDSGQEFELTDAFYLGTHEITQHQFQRVMSTELGAAANQSKHNQGEQNAPVENVSFVHAELFCKLLNEMTEIPAELNLQIPGDFEFVLPTGDQWEYACRRSYGCLNGDTPGKRQVIKYEVCYLFDTELNREQEYHKPAVVGSKQSPGESGFYDLIGNVQEWCAEGMSDKVVARGGSYLHNYADFSISKARSESKMTRSEQIGFRVAAVRKTTDQD